MDHGPAISVVVASYNRRAGLEQLLRALAVQTCAASRFEVVVVDDGSTDGTSDLLARIAVPFSLRGLSQENKGPAAARNLGVAHARGRIVLFLDDDVVPARGLLAAHELAHGDATNRVVIGPMLPPPTTWKQPAWDRWDAEQLQKQYRAMRDGLFACSPRQFYTANASVQRVSFQAAGGFDETFRRAEDVELAWRMSQHGAEFRFEPGAEVVHYAARTFQSWRRNAYQYGRYDVMMERDKAIPAFRIACREFHDRRTANRWLAWRCVGHTSVRIPTLAGLVTIARLADAVRARRVASLALSSIFGVQYWQGASDELGGPVPLRAAIATAATAREREHRRSEARHAIERHRSEAGPPSAPDATGQRDSLVTGVQG